MLYRELLVKDNSQTYQKESLDPELTGIDLEIKRLRAQNAISELLHAENLEVDGELDTLVITWGRPEKTE